MMTSCKRQVKTTRHLICSSCRNWWTSSSPGVRSPGLRFRRVVLVLSVWGCEEMKELEVELEQLRLLVVAMVGREQVVCASGSGGGGDSR